MWNYTLHFLFLSSISVLLSPCRTTAVQFVHAWQILRVSLIFYKRGTDFIWKQGELIKVGYLITSKKCGCLLVTSACQIAWSLVDIYFYKVYGESKTFKILVPCWILVPIPYQKSAPSSSDMICCCTRLSFIFYSMWIKKWRYAIFFTFYFLLFSLFS